jgi:hypothetical protein
MPLQIEFKGTSLEQEYIKQRIYPFKKEDASYMRNYYLDLILLGEKEFNAIKQGSSVVGDVSIIIEPYGVSANTYSVLDCMHSGNILRSMSRESIMPRINGALTPELVFALYPKSGKLEYFDNLSKLHVFSANDKSILFGYAIGENRHPCDVSFILNMFYNPKE